MAEFHLRFANEETVRALSAERREPPWLLKDRLAALSSFNGLAIEEMQLFIKYTSVGTAMVGETVPYVKPPDPPQEGGPVREGISGEFHQEEAAIKVLGLSPELRSRGVVLDTLQNMSVSHPDLVKSLICDRQSLPGRDKFAQMTRALWMAGVVLHVPDDVAVPNPIHIRWSVGREKTALLTRTLLSLGNNCRVGVVDEVDSSPVSDGMHQALYSGTAEASIGSDSKLDYVGVSNAGDNTVSFLNRHASVGRNSEARWSLGYVGGLVTKSRVDNLLQGRGAAVKEVQVLYGGKSQYFDLFSHTRHIAEDTVSNLLSKGVIQEQSKAYTKGLIKIEKGGKGSDSYLGEFGMALSRDARFLAIPSLEIENYAVRRAKHSSSVQQIDDRQVFYLMTRGIEEREARRLIVMGFLEPVVERIPLEDAANRLRSMFLSKWAG